MSPVLLVAIFNLAIGVGLPLLSMLAYSLTRKRIVFIVGLAVHSMVVALFGLFSILHALMWLAYVLLYMVSGEPRGGGNGQRMD